MNAARHDPAKIPSVQSGSGPPSPLFQAFAVIVIVTGFVVSYTVGYFTARRPPAFLNQARPPAELPRVPSPTAAAAALTDDIYCTETECLISDRSGTYGYSEINGYYRSYDGTQWEWNNTPVTCHGFIPADGRSGLLDDFRRLIESGNTLNKVIGGQMHINIRPDDLSPADRVALLQSTQDSPVTIRVLRPVPPGRGASTCESYLRILGIGK